MNSLTSLRKLLERNEGSYHWYIMLLSPLWIAGTYSRRNDAGRRSHCDSCMNYFMVHHDCPRTQAIDREKAVEWAQQKSFTFFETEYPYHLRSVITDHRDSIFYNDEQPVFSLTTWISEGICSECLRLFEKKDCGDLQ